MIRRICLYLRFIVLFSLLSIAYVKGATDFRFEELGTIIEEVKKSNNGSILSIDMVKTDQGEAFFLFKVVSNDNEVSYVRKPCS